MTDTDLVRVTDTLGDLVLGFLDLDKVRVTEPVCDTVRVQGLVACVLAGERERVLVTDIDLVLVTDTVGDLEFGFLDLDKVRVTEPERDTVRVQGMVPTVLAGVRERVLVTDGVALILDKAKEIPPLDSAHKKMITKRDRLFNITGLVARKNILPGPLCGCVRVR